MRIYGGRYTIRRCEEESVRIRCEGPGVRTSYTRLAYRGDEGAVCCGRSGGERGCMQLSGTYYAAHGCGTRRAQRAVDGHRSVGGVKA